MALQPNRPAPPLRAVAGAEDVQAAISRGIDRAMRRMPTGDEWEARLKAMLELFITDELFPIRSSPIE